MRIGFFTDTYFPQVSGVATSIKTLRSELEARGHEVYIFTTTDPNAEDFEENIIRVPSIPFVFYKGRRVAVRGWWSTYQIAKKLELDIIHTHTEFSLGLIGKMIGKRMNIPIIHTYHTLYEEYLHFFAHGKILKPKHVRQYTRLFVENSTGVVCPSKRVADTLKCYDVDVPMKIVPTGVKLDSFNRSEITEEMTGQLRSRLGISSDQIMILSLGRISFEKNIQSIIQQFPKVIKNCPNARLVIVGKGPYQEILEEMVDRLEINEFVHFVGEVSYSEVPLYYHASDYFVCASSSEAQGLTYVEAIASGTKCVVKGNDYLESIFDDKKLGVTYDDEHEFSETLIKYMKEEVSLDKKTEEDKLDEISSERFGYDISTFYEQMNMYYKLQNQKIYLS